MSNVVSKKKSVYANNGDTWVAVQISVVVRDKALTRDEHTIALDHITSKTMEAIADAVYVGVPLSRQRVGR
jgi:hypothetical protein